MIEIGNCGFDSVHRNAFHIRRPNGGSDYVLLLIKTEAYMEDGGVTKILPANSVILYEKDTYVHYGSTGSYYCDDWIHFMPEKKELDFLYSLKIPFNSPLRLPFFCHLTEFSRLIVLDKNTRHPYHQQSADALLRALLYATASQVNMPVNPAFNHKHYEQLNQLRMSIINTPNQKWTIDAMAKVVHMSPSYLQHLYKELFGITCIQECINARLKHARSYLLTTDMPIQTIAMFCGYDNETHFMKQFKKYEHMTPSEYRFHSANGSSL